MAWRLKLDFGIMEGEGSIMETNDNNLTNDIKITFDALVTGQLTHYSIALENELDGMISDYFVGIDQKAVDFTRLFLRRDGLTFQDKIEIVRGMLPLFQEKIEIADLKSHLNRVEDFKSWRNAMAHGRNVPLNEAELRLRIQIVTRAGKEKIIEITPASHRRVIEDVQVLRTELQMMRSALWQAFGTRSEK